MSCTTSNNVLVSWKKYWHSSDWVMDIHWSTEQIRSDQIFWTTDWIGSDSIHCHLYNQLNLSWIYNLKFHIKLIFFNNDLNIFIKLFWYPKTLNMIMNIALIRNIHFENLNNMKSLKSLKKCSSRNPQSSQIFLPLNFLFYFSYVF